MAAILFNGVESFEQIVNTISTESPMWNLVKLAQAISEKKTLKSKILTLVAILDFRSAQSKLFSI